MHTKMLALIRRHGRFMAFIGLLCALAAITAAYVSDGAEAPPTLEPADTPVPTATPEAALPAVTSPTIVIKPTTIPTQDTQVTNPADDIASDRAALVALYNATDSANWTDNTNWLSDAPMGEWYGVTTALDGSVAELSLDGNNLSGEMPIDDRLPIPVPAVVIQRS